MITQNKRLIIILLSAALLLLIPLVAMQFTMEVVWSLSDFIVMGILLFGIGTICEVVLRKIKRIEYRIILFVSILATFFLIWAELAVGIFGTPFAGS